ncbi:MAG TPA: IPT/TIG domain-containing protein, partial [Bacteroidales bacterium]|nr:IPT/TIG domain-containing protein [Bacteroidales bacterium]
MMIFIVLYACEKESDRFRTYPRVRDMAVTDISESGARFKASVYALGTEPIIDHGFVWGNYTNPEIGNFDKVYLGATERTGEFTTEILTNLIKDREYYVKPFLITADHIIYGAAVSFVSLGSGAPVISGFEPHIAGWMDTLTIRGNNFSYRNGVNVVKLNDVRCEVIESSDTLLRAVVNYLLSSPKAVLSIDNIGNICTFTQDTFRLIPPVVTDFYPKKARWGDTLYIEGKYLKYPLYVPGNSVSLGSFKCSFLGSLNDSIYIVKIPNELDVVNSDLTIAVNGFSLTGNSPFELQSPMPFTFSPVTGTWGNTITLSGSFNTIISSNSVYFDDIKADIIRTNSNQLEIAVPSGLAKIKSQIIYKSDPFTVVSKDTFQLSEPLILSVYPLQGPNQTIVTIKGRFFSGGASVKFGETPANIISSNDSTLIVNAPDLSNGSYLITVQNKFLNSSSNFNFSINNPIITGIEPVMASFNDVVTVSFLNELSSGDEIQAFFGQYPAEILSLSGNILSVKVPVSLDSIPRNIIIRVNSQDVSSADKFTLSPPEITTFSPQYPSSGQDVIIVGNNFNPVSANNKVMWNQYQLTVKSSTKSEIVATLPLNLPRGSFKISVITGGYKRSSPEPLYMSKSYWLKINSPEIQSMSVLWDN